MYKPKATRVYISSSCTLQSRLSKNLMTNYQRYLYLSEGQNQSLNSCTLYIFFNIIFDRYLYQIYWLLYKSLFFPYLQCQHYKYLTSLDLIFTADSRNISPLLAFILLSNVVSINHYPLWIFFSLSTLSISILSGPYLHPGLRKFLSVTLSTLKMYILSGLRLFMETATVKLSEE